MSKPGDDGRQVPPPTPGAAARRELWQPTPGEHQEAEERGTTQALTQPADPAVTEALGVDPSAPPPAGRSLVVFVLVLVQRLYLAVGRLADRVNAIHEALARKPEIPDWLRELGSFLDRLEGLVRDRASTELVRGLGDELRMLQESVEVVVARSARTEVGRPPLPPPAPQPRELPAEVRASLERIERALATLTDARTVQQVPTRLEAIECKLPDTRLLPALGDRLTQLEADLAIGGGAGPIGVEVMNLKTQLDRVEAALERPSATRRPSRRRAAFFAVMLLIVFVATGAALWRLRSQHRVAPIAQLGSSAELATELRKLRNANLEATAELKAMVRCGHQECRKWWFEGTGSSQVMKRDQCQWVVDPDCVRSPPPAP